MASGRLTHTRDALAIVLWANAAVNLFAGIAAFPWRTDLGEWMGIGWVAWVLVGLFVGSAVIIAAVYLSGGPPNWVWGIAFANLVLGAAGWVVLALTWAGMDQEGKWLWAAVLDSLLAFGLLEVVALRRRL